MISAVTLCTKAVLKNTAFAYFNSVSACEDPHTEKSSLSTKALRSREKKRVKIVPLCQWLETIRTDLDHKHREQPPRFDRERAAFCACYGIRRSDPEQRNKCKDVEQKLWCQDLSPKGPAATARRTLRTKKKQRRMPDVPRTSIDIKPLRVWKTRRAGKTTYCLFVINLRRT